MKSIVVSLLILLLGVVDFSHCQCGGFNASDGSVYDLNSLTRSAADYQGIEAGTPYTYYWNFCRNLLSTTCVSPTPSTQVSATGTCTPIGYLPGVIKEHPKGPQAGIQLTYINSQDNKCNANSINRVTNIIVDCSNSSNTEFISITEPGVCVYQINMRSPFACPLIPQISLSYIAPTSGSVNGATKVFFVGNNFTPNTTCRFGLIPGLNPTYESDEVFLCTSPASPIQGTAQVSVSNDGKNWSNGVTFTWNLAK